MSFIVVHNTRTHTLTYTRRTRARDQAHKQNHLTLADLFWLPPSTLCRFDYFFCFANCKNSYKTHLILFIILRITEAQPHKPTHREYDYSPPIFFSSLSLAVFASTVSVCCQHAQNATYKKKPIIILWFTWTFLCLYIYKQKFCCCPAFFLSFCSNLIW